MDTYALKEFTAKMVLLLNPAAEHHMTTLWKDEEAVLKPDVYAKIKGYFDRPDTMITKEGIVARFWDFDLLELERAGDRPVWFHLQRLIDYILGCNNDPEVRFLYLSSHDYEPVNKGELDFGPFEEMIEQYMPEAF